MAVCFSMKTFLLVFILFLSNFALASKFLCQFKVNGSLTSQKGVMLKPGAKTNVFEGQGFRVYLTQKTVNYFEIEIFDGNAEARHYSGADLNAIGAKLNWTIWTLSYLTEVICQLRQR